MQGPRHFTSSKNNFKTENKSEPIILQSVLYIFPLFVELFCYLYYTHSPIIIYYMVLMINIFQILQGDLESIKCFKCIFYSQNNLLHYGYTNVHCSTWVQKKYSTKKGQLVLSVKNSANMAIYQYFYIQFSKALILPTFWSVRIFEDQASAERAATNNYRAGNHYFWDNLIDSRS